MWVGGEGCAKQPQMVTAGESTSRRAGRLLSAPGTAWLAGARRMPADTTHPSSAISAAPHSACCSPRAVASRSASGAVMPASGAVATIASEGPTPVPRPIAGPRGRNARGHALLRSRHALDGHHPHGGPARALAQAEHHEAGHQPDIAAAQRQRPGHVGQADGACGPAPHQHGARRGAVQPVFGPADAQRADRRGQQTAMPACSGPQRRSAGSTTPGSSTARQSCS